LSRKPRENSQYLIDLGEFDVFELHSNVVSTDQIDLDAFAQEVDVLKAHKVLS